MQQLGKYQLVAEIARGGMGIVYLAVAHGPARFSKLLVVKELKPELVEDPTFLEMFLEEARLAARLNHPNIVQTYEIGAEGNRHYMVMDYLEGVTLARVLRKKNEAFTLGMQLRIMCEILQGLSYAHELKDFDGTPLGIVHRDGTPQNVFITFDGQIKLVDFGIAKALDSTVETRTGVLKGKPAYMAPEQIGGEVDPRADIFSVGVMVWEAVVGRRMWHKKGDVEVLTNIIKGNIPSLREAKPDAPETIIRIVDRALAKNRDERYPTASDFQADLEAYLVMTKQDVSTREVGKLVAEIFASERVTTQATIEQHIASIKSGKPPEKLPSLRPPPNESLSTPSGQAGLSGSLRLADPPSFTPASVRSMPTETPAGTEMPSGASDVLARNLAATKQKKVLGIALGAAVLLVGGAIAFRTLRAPAGPDPNAFARPTAPEAAPIPAMHEVSLRVTPSSASISVEGVAMLNPGKRSCIHGQHLMVHASAAHYVSTDRELICESDESIELALQPEPVVVAPAVAPAVAAAAPAPAPFVPPVAAPGKRPAISAPPPATHAVADPAKTAPAPTTRPGDVSPTGGTRPNRPIDTANPYGNQ